MKRHVLAGIVAVVLIALGQRVAGQAPAQATPPVMSADEVVSAYFKARGGLDTWKAIQTIKTVGHMSAQGMDLPITIYGKRPNLSRQEITANGQTVINSFDGTTAWSLNPFSSPLPGAVTGPQAGMIKSQSDFDGSLVDYKDKGGTLALVGTETVDGAKVYHLTLTMPDGLVEQHYIDVEKFVETRMTTAVKAGGVTRVLETQMASYTSVEGILMPFLLKNLSDGVPEATLTIDTVAFNVTLDDAFFKMPVR